MVDGSKISKLEIPAKQSLTWLYERRLVPYDWAKLISALHVKYDELKAQFPESHGHESIRGIAAYLKESPKCYGTAKEIFTRLTTSPIEFSEKSFFGNYKNEVTREWQLLTSIYEKGSLYWAEQAKFLQQATCFDLISLRKQLANSQKTKNEGEQKCGALESSIFDLERRYKEACQEFWLEPSEDS